MIRPVIAGICAGGVTGLFGAGGGMVLIPLLTILTDIEEQALFPTSISIILPICITVLLLTAFRQGIDLAASVPYLLGGAAGGFLAGKWGAKIPAKWLHRGLGLLILWGGFRYLWQS